MPQKGNQGEADRSTIFIAPKPLPEHKMLKCENPECGKQFYRRHARTRKPSRYCSRACQMRHAELLRGKCARAGCGNYKPSAARRYCSSECYHLVHYSPRQECARDGCSNMTTAPNHKYCGQACADLCRDYVEMARKANEVQKNYKQATGHIYAEQKRRAAVRKNNQLAPPRAKIPREGKAYGYPVKLEPMDGQYRGYVPALAGIIVWHKTKKGVLLEIKKMMRDQGLATTNRAVKPFIVNKDEGT